MMAGEGGWLEDATLVAHCLLIETDDGLVLVDTGYGTGDIADPKRLGLPFSQAIRPQLRAEETALAQVEALGFSAADVRHIVPTHLDVDHAGGISDFPEAEVHIFADEHDAATNPGLREKPRYLRAHFEHGPRWTRYEVEGDKWFGFDSVRVIGADSEVALIPLPGHSRGHCAVAVDSDGWMLHCGDAYFHRNEIADHPSCPPGLVVFETLVALRNGERKRNRDRLAELARDHRDEIEIFCAHDEVELARMQSRAG